MTVHDFLLSAAEVLAEPSKTAAWSAVAAFSALGGAGGVVALIKSRADRRKIIAETAKTDAETVAVLSAVAIQMMKSLQARITDLETALRVAETRTAEAETRLRKCLGQLGKGS